MIVIGDVHGNYELLMRFVEQLPHDNLAFVGDLFDRGPDSKKVVDFVRTNNYTCVLGNHEEFAIQSYDKKLNREPFTYRLWQSRSNGGWNTLESYKDNMDKFFEDREWFKTLPLFYWIDEEHVVSHSYYLPYKDQENDRYFKDNVLWERFINPNSNYGEIVNIHGHTIVKDVTFVGNNFLNIDTGANHFGLLSGVDTETNLIYQIRR